MNEYRFTRPDKYPKGSLGYANMAARQGHYILAESLADAGKIMRERFPNDIHLSGALWRKAV